MPRTQRRAPLSRTARPSGAPRRLLAVFEAADLEAFIDAALDVLRHAVPCEFASAFYVSGPNGLFKERDSRGRRYDAAFMRRYVDLSPAIPMALANPGVQLLSTRMALPRSEIALRSTAFYREIMQSQGWRHAVALCFWDDPPSGLPVFVASVNRTQAQGDFSERDLTVLRGIHPSLDCAARLLRQRDAARTAQDGMAMAMTGDTRGHAILDANLFVVEATPMARRLCAAWDGDGLRADGGLSLPRHPPTAVLDACRDLHREWHALVRADPDMTGIRLHRRVVHPRNPALTASVTILCPRTQGLAGPVFVLEFERRVHGFTLDPLDDSSAVLHAMTPSERAVASELADGLSNQDIADRLGKTVSAVKFLLHRIYQKTGVPNRAALVALLRPQKAVGRRAPEQSDSPPRPG